MWRMMGSAFTAPICSLDEARSPHRQNGIVLRNNSLIYNKIVDNRRCGKIQVAGGVRGNWRRRRQIQNIGAMDTIKSIYVLGGTKERR
jgi:hypothetical protein